MSVSNKFKIYFQIENSLSILRSSDLSDEQICQIEESIKREEEEELERSTAKERWLKEREVMKRTLQEIYKKIPFDYRASEYRKCSIHN